MALTMVHLLVADQWAQGHPEYRANPDFYLGAISPDAIHIRDHGDKSRKDEFHLYNWQIFHREPLEAYWLECHSSFDIGYGVHVLTDCQWVDRYKQRLKGLFLPDGKLNIPVYYNDTFVTDFELYHESPRLNEILNMIECAGAPGDHPLLTRDEFDQWRRMIIEAYRGQCPKDAPVQYITKGYVGAFVTDAIALIDEEFCRVFR